MLLRNIIRAIAFLCLGFFVYFVIRVGPQEIWMAARKVSWFGLAALMVFRFVYLLLRTENWKLVLDRIDGSVSLWHLFKVRIAAISVGYLTPASKVGGEATRILLVDGVSRKKTAASVVVEKTIEWLSAAVLILIGVTIAVMRFPLAPGFKWMIILINGLGFLVVVVFFLMQRKGVFMWGVRILDKFRIRPKFFLRHIDKIQETDQHISRFYATSPMTFLGVFLGFILMFLIWTFEFKLTFIFLGAGGISFLDCYILATFGALALAVPGLPASIGIFEMTFVSVYSLLGISPDTGMALIMVRRIIGMIWAGLGIIPLMRMKKIPARKSGR